MTGQTISSAETSTVTLRRYSSSSVLSKVYYIHSWGVSGIYILIPEVWVSARALHILNKPWCCILRSAVTSIIEALGVLRPRQSHIRYCAVKIHSICCPTVICLCLDSTVPQHQISHFPALTLAAMLAIILSTSLTVDFLKQGIKFDPPKNMQSNSIFLAALPASIPSVVIHPILLTEIWVTPNSANRKSASCALGWRNL